MTTGYYMKDGLPHIDKVAGVTLEYTFGLTAYFAAIGANMGGFTVTAQGLAYDQAETVKNGDDVTVFVGGGVVNRAYPVHLDFTYTGTTARSDRRTIVINVVAAKS